MNTYGELIRWLISEYEEGINNLPGDKFERDKYLCDKDIYCGICLKSDSIGVSIYTTYFIKEYCGSNLYLCKSPRLETYEDSKKYLQIRLDRLKEVLPKWENVSLIID